MLGIITPSGLPTRAFNALNQVIIDMRKAEGFLDPYDFTISREYVLQLIVKGKIRLELDYTGIGPDCRRHILQWLDIQTSLPQGDGEDQREEPLDGDWPLPPLSTRGFSGAFIEDNASLPHLNTPR